MDKAGSTTTRARAAAMAAGAVMAFSMGIVAYGIVDSSVPASVGGGLTGLAAATMMALAKMRTWAVDTSAQRRQLEEALQKAHDERTRYVAAQGAQSEEHRRRLRDLEGERARNQQQLAADKAALDEQYEARREALIIDSMETGIRLYRAGLLGARNQTPGEVVQFRTRQRGEAANVHPADPAPNPHAARDREIGRP